MAAINQELLGKLYKRTGLSRPRIYQMIQQIARERHVPNHVAALILGQENGLSIHRYAEADDFAVMQAAPRPNAAAIAAPAAAVSATRRQAAPKKKAAKRVAKKVAENTVFVVHGRDKDLTDAVYALLGAVGLRPQEWAHAMANAKGNNPYINDVVTQVMAMAQAIVIILSPDDEARLQDHFVRPQERATEGKLRGQARPNVLYEMGLAMGNHSHKTVVVKVGDPKTCSDLDGMHIPHLNNSVESRKDFISRLRKAGCHVDDAGTLWLTTGDLRPAAQKGAKAKKAGRK